MQIAEAGNRT